MDRLKVWIEAMRLRTLPVSLAGVITALLGARAYGQVRLWPALLCVGVALLAQIASNFANEYFDFKAGLDSPGRVGPRRGVTEGDITPRAMLLATLLTLATSCAMGLALLLWGPWWLLIVGVLVAAGVFAYSAGPWPLSRHGLGEVAVIVFFGLVPVNFSFMLISGSPVPHQVLMMSVAMGLMGANVLLVNNYRDRDDDAAVGKHTLAVLFGRRFALTLYIINGLAATALMWPAHGPWVLVYLLPHLTLCYRLAVRSGRALNPLLGLTAMLMLAAALLPWSFR